MYNFQILGATSKFLKAVSNFWKLMLILIAIQYLQLEFQNLEFLTRQSVFSTDSTSNFLKNGIIFLSMYIYLYQCSQSQSGFLGSTQFWVQFSGSNGVRLALSILKRV